MSLFLITARDQAERVAEAVKNVYAPDVFEVHSSSWLVTDTLSTREVSIKLGFRDGVLGALALVAKVNAYSGWSDRRMWDWLSARPEALSNG